MSRYGLGLTRKSRLYMCRFGGLVVIIEIEPVKQSVSK